MDTSLLRHTCTASWSVNVLGFVNSSLWIVSYRIPAMIVSITLCSNSILSRVPHFFCFQFYSGHKIVYRFFGSLSDLLEVKPG